VSEEVTACALCPRLVEWRERAAREAPPAYRGERYWARPLPGFGDPTARLVLVGLAPAAHGGNRTGRIFTGDRSGDFLFAALFRGGFANKPTSVRADDGLALTDVYVTAAVRCAPPGNRPSPSERDNCAGYLRAELGLLEGARVLMALGNFAYEALWRLPEVRPGREARQPSRDPRRPRTPSAGTTTVSPRSRPRFVHGLEVPLPPLRPGHPRRTLVCSYHPSQRNVFTGLLTEAMFDKVLARAGALAAGDT
jgi:uracil-DNA glycosylase family 4